MNIIIKSIANTLSDQLPLPINKLNVAKTQETSSDWCSFQQTDKTTVSTFRRGTYLQSIRTSHKLFYSPASLTAHLSTSTTHPQANTICMYKFREYQFPLNSQHTNSSSSTTFKHKFIRSVAFHFLPPMDAFDVGPTRAPNFFPSN